MVAYLYVSRVVGVFANPNGIIQTSYIQEPHVLYIEVFCLVIHVKCSKHILNNGHWKISVF